MIASETKTMPIVRDAPALVHVMLRRIADLRRQRGWTGAAAHCMACLWQLPKLLKRIGAEIAYDREMGVQTSRPVSAADLGVHPGKLTDVSTGSRGAVYMPSPRWALTEMLSELNISYPEYTFVDLGSGMGRIVLMASEFHFRKVIGVEFSPELHQIAEANVAARSKMTRTDAVELICQDAREYILPPGNCVVYMFNPFQGNVMTDVLTNLEQAFSKGRNDLYVLYFNPVCRPLLDKAGFLTKISARRHYSIYRRSQG
jgi:hypothetical protein